MGIWEAEQHTPHWPRLQAGAQGHSNLALSQYGCQLSQKCTLLTEQRHHSVTCPKCCSSALADTGITLHGVQRPPLPTGGLSRGLRVCHVGSWPEKPCLQQDEAVCLSTRRATRNTARQSMGTPHRWPIPVDATRQSAAPTATHPAMRAFSPLPRRLPLAPTLPAANASHGARPLWSDPSTRPGLALTGTGAPLPPTCPAAGAGPCASRRAQGLCPDEVRAGRRRRLNE